MQCEEMVGKRTSINGSSRYDGGLISYVLRIVTANKPDLTLFRHQLLVYLYFLTTSSDYTSTTTIEKIQG